MDADSAIKEKPLNEPGADLSISVKRHKFSAKKSLMLWLAGIIIIISVTFYFLRTGKNSSELSSKIFRIPDREKSIAVLPFYDDSPGKDNAYFCNGMMEELITHLQNIADLQVKSRTEVMGYWHADKDFRLLSSELKAAYLVEGSVRKAGEDLRITVQLINSKSGDHLWAETYNGKFSDKLFEFQSKIAEKIAISMNAVITNPERQRIERDPKTNIAAYDYVLKANELSRKFWETHDKSYITSIQYYAGKAFEIDDDSPLTNLLKAQTFNMEAENMDRSFFRIKIDSANYYADRAIKRDPYLAEAFQLKGRLSTNWDIEKGYYAKALEIKPNTLSILEMIGWHDNQQKTREEILIGLAFYKKAIEISTEGDAGYYYRKAYYYYFQENYPEAMEYFRTSMKKDNYTHPAFHHIAVVLMDQGKYDEAIAFVDSVNTGELDAFCHTLYFRNYLQKKQFDVAEKHFNHLLDRHFNVYPGDSIKLGYIYLYTGRKMEGISILKRMKADHMSFLDQKKESGDYVFWELIRLISICSALGEKDEALKYLSGLEQSFILFSFTDQFDRSILLDNIREEPEFRAIMQRAEKKRQKLKKEIAELFDPV
jgi:TolB-like protein/Tfp pilus assembly protein PilF